MTKLSLYPSIPDKNCPDCSGTGWIDKGGKRCQCNCVIKNKALAYLTPVFNDPLLRSLSDGISLNLDSWITFVIAKEFKLFKSLVRKMLLATGCSDTFLAVTPYEIIQAYLDTNPSVVELSDRPIVSLDDSRLHNNLKFINGMAPSTQLSLTQIRDLPDVLILIMDGSDPVNRAYSSIIKHILTHRSQNLLKKTIIWAPFSSVSSMFGTKYGSELATYFEGIQSDSELYKTVDLRDASSRISERQESENTSVVSPSVIPTKNTYVSRTSNPYESRSSRLWDRTSVSDSTSRSYGKKSKSSLD